MSRSRLCPVAKASWSPTTVSHCTNHHDSRKLLLPPARGIAATAATKLFSSSSSSSSNNGFIMTGKPWIVTYQYVPDILEKRGPYREQHLYYARDVHRCYYGGPLCDDGTTTPTGALFLFPTYEQAAAFVQDDPYVVHQLVTSYQLAEWNIVIHPTSSTS